MNTIRMNGARTARLTFAKLPTTYVGLVKLHMPRPIRDALDYDNVTEIVDLLAVAGEDKLTADQADYLEMLSGTIERYDAEHTPHPPATGVGVLKYLLEEHGQGAEDLAKILKVGRSAAYHILSGERKLTALHIKRLCERFGVSADTFIF